MQHLDKHILGNYVGGDLTEQELSHCQRHLVECNACRQELALLVRMLDEEISPEELTILNSIETATPEPGHGAAHPLNLYERFCEWLGPGWKLAVVSASVILIVAAAGTILYKNSSGIQFPTSVSERTFEARLSGQPYSEFVHIRTAPRTDKPASANDELKRLRASHLEMGRFYLQHSEFGKAAAELEDAKKQEPDSVEIYNDLGVAYMESGVDDNLDKAVGQFREALKRNSRYGPAEFNLALAYERLGEFPEAEQELRRYLQIDPDSDWAKEVRSKLQLWKH